MLIYYKNSIADTDRAHNPTDVDMGHSSLRIFITFLIFLTSSEDCPKVSYASLNIFLMKGDIYGANYFVFLEWINICAITYISHSTEYRLSLLKSTCCVTQQFSFRENYICAGTYHFVHYRSFHDIHFSTEHFMTLS